MLAGAMKELKVKDLGSLSTDVGPVIDEDAGAILVEYLPHALMPKAKKIGEASMTRAWPANAAVLRPARLRDPLAVGAHPRNLRPESARDPLEGQRAGIG